MLDEAKKREKVANAVLGLAFATSAAQSPKDFVRTGNVESPGVAMMQRTIGNPRRQRKDLDNPRVVSRGTKLKEAKTFKQFLEEASMIAEMRKEDKVAGKKKTPLSISTTHKTVASAPEGSGKKWERKDVEIKKGNPVVSAGRYRQGAAGGSEYGYERHPHGGEHGGMSAGSRRGVKKVPGEKKPEVGHVTPAQKVANKKYRQANLSYLFGGRR